jgi:hypothetical protein
VDLVVVVVGLEPAVVRACVRGHARDDAHDAVGPDDPVVKQLLVGPNAPEQPAEIEAWRRCP